MAYHLGFDDARTITNAANQMAYYLGFDDASTITNATNQNGLPSRVLCARTITTAANEMAHHNELCKTNVLSPPV